MNGRPRRAGQKNEIPPGRRGSASGHRRSIGDNAVEAIFHPERRSKNREGALWGGKDSTQVPEAAARLFLPRRRNLLDHLKKAGNEGERTEKREETEMQSTLKRESPRPGRMPGEFGLRRKER